MATTVILTLSRRLIPKQGDTTNNAHDNAITMENVNLRLAKIAEAKSIAIISRDLVENELPWRWTPSRIQKNIHNPDTVVLAADIGHRLVGFAIMDFDDEEAHLNLLAVSENYQRSGIGTHLVKWLEKSAVVAGISIIYLEVRASNTGAQTFYQQLGYRKIQHLFGYYQGREAAVRMARDLWDHPSNIS